MNVMENTEEAPGIGSVGSAAPVERGTLRDTLRELLFEIPGFRALAERGISAELISPPPHSVGSGNHPDHSSPAEAAEGRPHPPRGNSGTEVNTEGGTSKHLISSQLSKYVLFL